MRRIASENVPDSGLRAALLYHTGYWFFGRRLWPPFRFASTIGMRRITRLFAEKHGIRDLSGLALCSHLNELRVGDNEIQSLAPISKSTTLEILFASGNQVSDLSSISTLVRLQNIVMERNQISDLSPLASLRELRNLCLSHNHITDLAPLSRLNNLQNLRLYDNRIEDLAPLSSLENLEVLELGMNRIVDISPLTKLKRLRLLTLSRNNITDISPLAYMDHVRQIDIRHNTFKDISPLFWVTYADGNADVLAEDTSFPESEHKWVYAIGTHLHGFSLAEWSYKNSSPLEALVRVAQGSSQPGLLENGQTNSNLVQFADLGLEFRVRKAMNIFSTPITVSQAKNLRRLDASAAEIRDIRGIEHFTNLQYLDLSNNRISDISPLARIVAIECLNLEDNPSVRDLTCLADSPVLSNIRIDEKWLSEESRRILRRSSI